jgi:hypothetical protein
MKKIIKVNWSEIVLFEQKEEDYISLTDIAKKKNKEFPADIIKNWLKTKNTIEFLWLWERINNPSFKLVEFDQFKNEAWSNAFVLSPQKWIEKTNAIWIISKSWRYWWTYAHKDIAFEFASWISVEFKYYLIKEFQRLKDEENERKLLWWDIKRNLAKINYRLQTDAIQTHIIPTLSEFKKQYVYSDEADLLNIIIFWKTAKDWEVENPELAKSWNIRDYAWVIDLSILSNLESFNSEFIKEWLSKEDRFERLSEIAKNQKISMLKVAKEPKKIN